MQGPERIEVTIEGDHRVSGLIDAPSAARAMLVLAHGAGAGMSHAFMEGVASGLAQRGIATLRYQFPYMERGSKRPDSPVVAYLAVRAAVAEAARRAAGVPLFAGGKSFGARMTSQAQAADPLTDVRGLVFFGFPLHPAGKPSIERAQHLGGVTVPMLFLQGTRDDLAHLALVRIALQGLGSRASLVELESADHAFHVPARSGRNDVQLLDVALDAAAGWIDKCIGGGR